MAIPSSYLTSTKNIPAIFTAIQTAQAPDKFTTRVLEALGFKSNNDRLIIGVLKALGFLDGAGTPQDRYFRFLDQGESRVVLAEAITDAYSDLFQVNKNAQNIPRTELVNKMKTLSQGKYSESVLTKMAMTFIALSKEADFDSLSKFSRREEGSVQSSKSLESDEREAIEFSAGSESAQALTQNHSLGGLHYNIQIILPESRDPKVYDVLFRSLKEHLIV